MKKTMKIGFVFLLSLLSVGAMAQSNESAVRGSVSTNLPDNGKVRTSAVRGVLNDMIDYAAQRTPFLTMAQVRAGKADTARVVHITDAGRAGTFLYNSTSTATDDGAMVLVASGRRYIRVVYGPIKAEWFGAVGDGTTNDLAALTAFLAYPGSEHLLEAGKTYRVNGTLNVDVRNLDMNGSTMNFFTTGATAGMRVKSNSVLKNGVITNTVTSPSGHGEWGNAIIIGEYQTTVEYKNIVIDNISVSSNRPNSAGICMIGNVHDATVKNITIPNTSTIGRGIMMHWGNANTPQASFPTVHPYNITVENVTIGAMTYTALPTDVGGVTMSACRNITVRNVKIAQAHNALLIVAGDYGFEYASAADKQSAYKGITIDGVVCDEVTRHGIDIQGLSASVSINQAMPILIQNCSFRTATQTTKRGVNIVNTSSMTFRKNKVSGFLYGYIDAGNTHNILIDDNDATFCEYPYAFLAAASGYSTNWIVTNNRSIGNTSASTARGSFQTDYTRNITFQNNYSSDSIMRGIRIGENTTGANLYNNYVRAVKAGGVAYSLGALTNYATVSNFIGNRFDASVPNATEGMNPIIVQTNPSGTKRLRGPRPSSGTWTIGDFVELTTYTQAGTTPNKYVITGYLRITTGSGNILNTDWVEARTLTGN